jgi:hypothetical protein
LEAKGIVTKGQKSPLTKGENENDDRSDAAYTFSAKCGRWLEAYFKVHLEIYISSTDIFNAHYN